MNPILRLLITHRFTRYGMFFISGGLVVSWVMIHNEAAAKAIKDFWAQPIIGLVLTLAGLWAGQSSKKDWEKRVEDALMMPPPEVKP